MPTANEPLFERFKMLALNTRKVRINGAAALEMWHVAAGTRDGYFETGLYLWDHAAAGLIAEQAGATISLYPRHDEAHGANIICSNPHLMPGLQAIYTKCS